MKKESLLNILLKKFNMSEKEANGLILSGNVLVDNVPITKSGIKINTDKKIRIKQKNKYVSRGAYKLLSILDNNNIIIKDKICLDAGCSTGGFTQVLLEKGAKKVIAVDCGYNVLHYSLRNNPKILLLENTKITDLKKENINFKIDLLTMDLSFTSSVHNIEYLYNEFLINEMIILVKPQFEYNRLKNILNLDDNFKGIIKSEETTNKIINFIKKEIISKELKINSIIKSNIKGTKGNLEYLFYINNTDK